MRERPHKPVRTILDAIRKRNEQPIETEAKADTFYVVDRNGAMIPTAVIRQGDNVLTSHRCYRAAMRAAETRAGLPAPRNDRMVQL